MQRIHQAQTTLPGKFAHRENHDASAAVRHGIINVSQNAHTFALINGYERRVQQRFREVLGARERMSLARS
jgi:hypothetical protein